MEFEKTDSSKLTIEEFDTKHIDLEQESDPPCYTEGLRKAKLAQVGHQYLCMYLLISLLSHDSCIVDFDCEKKVIISRSFVIVMQPFSVYSVTTYFEVS